MSGIFVRVSAGVNRNGLQYGGVIKGPYYSKRTYVLRHETMQYLDDLYQCGYGNKSEIINRAVAVYYALRMGTADDLGKNR